MYEYWHGLHAVGREAPHPCPRRRLQPGLKEYVREGEQDTLGHHECAGMKAPPQKPATQRRCMRL